MCTCVHVCVCVCLCVCVCVFCTVFLDVEHTIGLDFRYQRRQTIPWHKIEFATEEGPVGDERQQHFVVQG